MSDDDPSPGRWSPEETERLLSQLDEFTRSSIESNFEMRESNGIITMDQLIEIMTELNVAYDPDTLSGIVEDDEWECIDLPLAMLIVAHCMDSTQRDQGPGQTAAEKTVAVSQPASQIVSLNTFEYLWYRLPCSTKAEGVDYRWTGITLDLRPKTILMVSAFMTLLIACVVLVVSMIAMSEYTAYDEGDRALVHFSQFLNASTSIILDEAMSSVVAQSLEDSVGIVSALTDAMMTAHEEVVKEHLTFGLSVVQSAIESHGLALLNAEEELLQAALTTILSIFNVTGTVGGLSEVLQANYRESSLHGFLISGSAGVLYSSPICELFAQLPIFSRWSSWATTGNETACGQLMYFVCANITRLGVKVCLAQTDSVRTAVLDEGVADLVTQMNLQRPETSLETQVAVRTSDGGFKEIGGRKAPVALCVQHQECGNGMEVYEWAANQSSPGARIVTGYDVEQWLAAYSAASVRSRNYFLAMKENLQETRQGLYSALSSASLLSESDPKVVYGVYDFYNRVNILNLNISGSYQNASDLSSASAGNVSRQTYLEYALNGREGIAYPTLSDPRSLMAGYHSTSESQVAVGVEYSAEDVTAQCVRFLLTHATSLSRTLPSNWDLSLSQLGSNGIVSYLVPPRLYNPTIPTACEDDGVCADHIGVLEAYRSKLSSGFVDGVDPQGNKFHGWFTYLDLSPPAVLWLQYSHSSLEDDVLQRRLIAIGIGVGIFLAAELVLLLLTQRVLDRIEADYNNYKNQIEEEKRQFSNLVKDVMPAYIAERIMKGTRIVAETHPLLTFYFSDVVGFSELSSTWTNKEVVRVLGYSFLVQDEVAAHFGVHKIKTIGDSYFAVAGLEEFGGSTATGKDHQVFRTVSFACLTQQLFGSTFDHFPERTDCFRILNGGKVPTEPMKMVRLRIGIHCGSALAGVVDVGRAPHFDCFGPSVNLASRMEATSAAGRVQVSGPAQELLAKVDRDGLFEFDAPKKTLVKGFGAITTCLIKSTNLQVPERILQKLHIQRSNRRQFFVAAVEAERNRVLVPSSEGRRDASNIRKERETDSQVSSDQKSVDKDGISHSANKYLTSRDEFRNQSLLHPNEVPHEDGHLPPGASNIGGPSATRLSQFPAFPPPLPPLGSLDGIGAGVPPPGSEEPPLPSLLDIVGLPQPLSRNTTAIPPPPPLPEPEPDRAAPLPSVPVNVHLPLLMVALPPPPPPD
jgi:class 3 adenylate cyclase